MCSIRETQTIKVSNKRLWSASINHDGSILAICGENKSISLFTKCLDDLWESQCILSDGHKRSIRNLSWSPCGNYFASASFDGSVVIWKLMKETCEAEALATLEGHTSEVKCVAWSKNGHFIATCGRDRSIWFWEFDDEEDVQCLSVLQPHSQDVKSVAWHPKYEILVSASYDNVINLYKEELDDWTVYAKLYGHNSTVWKAEFSTSGEILASCSDDMCIKLWSSDGPIESSTCWLCVATLRDYHTDTIYDVSWLFGVHIDRKDANDPEYLSNAYKVSNSLLFLFHIVHTGIYTNDRRDRLHSGMLCELGTNEGVTLPLPSFDDQYLASCGADNRLCIFKLPLNGIIQRGGKPEMDEIPVLWSQVSDAHKEDVNSVCWFPKLSSSTLATVGDDGFLKFWSVQRESS